MKKFGRVVLYILCVYDLYLYLPDIFDSFKIDFEPPTTDYLLYFDAALLLFGGVILGVLLIKKGNKRLGWLMILMNLTLTPLFVFKALP